MWYVMHVKKYTLALLFNVGVISVMWIIIQVY